MSTNKVRVAEAALITGCTLFGTVAALLLISAPADAGARWTAVSKAFVEHHRSSANIFAHCITTPLSTLAVLALFNKATRTTQVSMGLAVLYCLSLVHRTPFEVLIPSCVLAVALAGCAQLLSTQTYPLLAALFVFNYAGQEAAHLLTAESTFQGSYQGASNFWHLLAEHTYFLIPLIFESVSPATQPWSGKTTLLQLALAVSATLGTLTLHFLSTAGALHFPWQHQRTRMCTVKLTGASDTADMKMIRAWAIEQKPSAATSTHWWFQAPTPETPQEQCLPPAIKAAFSRVAQSQTMVNMYRDRFGSDWTVDVITGMNEVYVSSPTNIKGTSDQVFYTKHIDGPYYYVPFASCFRVIVGLDKNEEIVTKFPMVPAKKAAQAGDALAFDFHREVHYIEKEPGVVNDDFRVVLKVHHCVYPPWAGFWGKLLGFLSTRYNQLFRALFLYTLSPKTPYEKFASFHVNFVTWVYCEVEERIGYTNVGWFATLAALVAAANALGYSGYKLFLIGTSFVHYIRYINTYYHREGAAYGEFKRDVFLFKALSVGQLLFLYVSAVTASFTNLRALLSLSLLEYCLVLGGYALSMYCTFLLGVDGTYFGIELGVVKADKYYVQRFPYGVVPHPMILAQCAAMVGLFLHPTFRADWPYLVPTHIALYLVHMVQEHFDIHKNKSRQMADTVRKTQ